MVAADVGSGKKANAVSFNRTIDVYARSKEQGKADACLQRIVNSGIDETAVSVTKNSRIPLDPLYRLDRPRFLKVLKSDFDVDLSLPALRRVGV